MFGLIKNTVFIGFLGGLLLMFSACENTQTRRNIICLVDFSSSKNDEARQQFYKTVIKNNVLKNLSPTDRITVIPLDAASVTNSQEILVKDLSTEDFTPDLAPPLEEEKLTAENLEKYKNQITSEFEQNFEKTAESRRESSSKGTDILGLLNNLGNYLKPDAHNYIIFLSDMMNYSETLKMEPANKNFNNSSIDKLVKGVPQVNLQNAKVFVLTGEQPDLPPAHFDLVSNFWKKYFEQNGANLSDYSSAAISRLDETMKIKQ